MKSLLFGLFAFVHLSSFAQTGLFAKKPVYTRQDSLRGSITPERAWWDLKKYKLYVAVDPNQKRISGRNTISYEVLKPYSVMQIDLQNPMEISKVTQEGKDLKFDREGNAYFISFEEKQELGARKEVTLTFMGKPRAVILAPWDGGFSWKKDSNGKHFIATSNQGIGASLWWPCKDHMYDEPEEGLELGINVPSDLVAVGNGRLIHTKKEKNKTKTYHWRVVNPINNYGVNINIADYAHISSGYDGLNGKLDVDFWVLKENKGKAKKHFQDAYRSLEAFEYWFGPYPFYEDSYKLVEVPYLGMEHQSSVTYGNNYRNGYNGRGFVERDLSGTGWGLKWDFIIVHETGHEWFANSITHRDIADLWIHEGFTSYAESLFTEYFYGKEAGAEYSRGLRKNVANRKTIIGDYEVNAKGSGDMYYKGHNMLHTIRQLIDDDSLWREMLLELNKDFYHQVVTTQQIEKYLIEKSGKELAPVFDQYLRDIRIPVLEYGIYDSEMQYRWTNCRKTFNMPLKATADGKEIWLNPTTSFQTLNESISDLQFDPNFYVYTFQIK